MIDEGRESREDNNLFYTCGLIEYISRKTKISPKIDDYNSSVYYESPSYIFECYKEKTIL